MTDLTELQKLYGRVKWEHFLPVLAKFIEPHAVPPSPIEAEEVEAVARLMWNTNRYHPEMPSFAHEYAWDDVWPQPVFKELMRALALSAIQASRDYWEKKT